MAHIHDVAPQKPQPPKKEPEHTSSPKAQASISWRTPEYEYREKTTDWYWTLGIITLLLAIFAIWERNFIFFVMIIVGSFTVVLYAVKRPSIVSITISGRGVQIDDRLFPYETLQSFWIFYEIGGEKEISFKTKGAISNSLKIPLGDLDPLEVRELLLRFLPEKTQERSLVDALMKRIGF